MYLIGTKNATTQTVLTDGLINIGNVYRKYCKRLSNGAKLFDNNSNSITVNGQGIYHITVTLVGSGTAAGDVTVQLLENETAIDGALSTQTITTADTEIRTFVIDYYMLVDSACLLGCSSTVAKTISLENTGVGATFTSVIVNVDKEV